MLPAAHRLRRSADFSTVIRSGVRAGRPTMVVHLARPAARGPVRGGLVVARSVGNSVVRHRVSRRLRHQLIQRLATVPEGTAMVIRALPAAAAASSADLGADLDAALRSALARKARRERGTVTHRSGVVAPSADSGSGIIDSRTSQAATSAAARQRPSRGDCQ